MRAAAQRRQQKELRAAWDRVRAGGLSAHDHWLLDEAFGRVGKGGWTEELQAELSWLFEDEA